MIVLRRSATGLLGCLLMLGWLAPASSTAQEASAEQATSAAQDAPATHGDSPPRPRLVVVVSVDQLPQSYLERFRQGFGEHGIAARTRERGATFTQCFHGHAGTITGPGHSVLLTGAYPWRTGIIDNNWYDRSSGKKVYCVADPETQLVGNLSESSTTGVSPRTLLVDTLGDAMKLSNGRSRVFGLGLKDRAGILMAGHAADGVFWFDEASGCFVSSTYYMDKLPAYLESFNRQALAASFVGQTWTPLLPADRYAGREGNESFAYTLPSAATPAYYKALLRSPLGNELTLMLARLILVEESLGQREAPDLLAINLSSNDYVGHAYGPHSLEVQDMTYRTDRQLGELCDFIDQHMQGQPWTLAISSDHGVAPVPEYAQQLRIPAGRTRGLLTALNTRLEERLRGELGAPVEKQTYLEHLSESDVYLRRSLPELKGERYLLAQRIVRDALLDEPLVRAAYLRDDLLRPSHSQPTHELGTLVQRSLHPKRSGDAVFVTAPYHHNSFGGTTHGTPWLYDRHVVLLMLGAGVKPGRYEGHVTPAQIAPTLARILGTSAPAGCEVEPLWQTGAR